MFQIVINPDITVEIPQVGLFYAFQGEEYVCLSTTTYQEQSGNPDKPWIPVFSTICLILRIDDEGDDLGEMPISVAADRLTEI